MERREMIKIEGNQFIPAEMEVEPETVVIFFNKSGNPHVVESDTGTFSSGEILPKGSYRFTFGHSGIYDFFSKLHPEMQGRIKVKSDNN